MTVRFLVIAALAAITAAALFFLRARELRYSSRSRGLEDAVRQRTEELERERAREKARNRILEMLVTNQPLGPVLDRVAQLVVGESSGAACAIVLKQSDRLRVAAAASASQLTDELVAALQTPHAVPFEVWKGTTEFRLPAHDPAWKIFSRQLGEPAPNVIRSKSIGRPDLSLGACLVFDWSAPQSELEPDMLDVAARLAQLAIEHSRLYDDLHFQAHHDSLTGLPNRVLFDHRLEQALADAHNRKRQAAVLYIDLDRFKQVNDTMSHRVGDLFLVEVADRLRREMRSGDMVARIGGDEFNVLLAAVDGAAEAEAVGERLRHALRQPVTIEGRSFLVTASIGIALFPDDGNEADDLQREADAAMYCAKGLGRDRVQAYTTRNSTLDPVRMDRELKKALRDRWFAMHYQPKVEAGGGFAGMEALLRLHHPVEGMIPPSEFIPMAEESGLIVPLGAWVLDEVCRQIDAWRDMNLGLVPVAVNLSPVQICRPDFAAEVEECLRRHQVPAAYIEFELTENLLIESNEETQKQMRRLRAAGIRFSIDDFGTGYSSLSYLHRLQVDSIKLDRSFVMSIDTDDAARRLVQAMIAVAEGLGLGVIAEGVETEAQRQVLIAAGCPAMQGFLFSRPLPAEELEGYLRAARTAHTPSDPDDLRRIESMCGPTAERVEALQTV